MHDEIISCDESQNIVVDVTFAGYGQDWTEHCVFIRHAMPTIEPNLPPSEWSLSSRGQSAAHELAESLTNQNLQRLVTSSERKAHSTAIIISEVLGVEVVVDDRLKEVVRPFIHERFSGAVFEYLRGSALEGWEPADQVVTRFSAAVTEHWLGGHYGVVTHGTALSLYLGSRGLVNADTFWEGLKMPDAWRFATKGMERLDFG